MKWLKTYLYLAIQLLSKSLRVFGKRSLVLRVKLDRYLMRKGAMPKVQYIMNPLLKYPRNANCWCGKAPIKKAKNCCLPTQAQLVPRELGVKLVEYMDYVEKNVDTTKRWDGTLK